MLGRINQEHVVVECRRPRVTAQVAAPTHSDEVVRQNEGSKQGVAIAAAGIAAIAFISATMAWVGTAASEMTLGIYATTAVVVSFVPQLIKTVRTRSVADLSLPMLWLIVSANFGNLGYLFIKSRSENVAPLIVNNAGQGILGTMLILLHARFDYETTRVLKCRCTGGTI